ncbi:MAG TPA: FAD-dependent oxidoreductase [Deltaproteobacteria bacterium]|nr:FAD-dependent oxidoreductase [Deltaproteobacteria bacterium]HPR54836.1 FAD-dependent oxidoreductase [Deltaproteobacteria bacterium]HXK46539.1 FAD-dependent oxidoreductase [Deltaproteobacteria bacterium]
MERLSHLLSPITVRGITLENRVVMPPMGTNLGNKDATVSDAVLAYIKRRADARPGLIITEIAAVHESGALIDTELGIYDDRFIPGLRKLSDTIHAGGARAAVQLHHGGRECFFLLNEGRALGPSAEASLIYGVPPKEMTLDDMRLIREAFGSAAVRARQAGFDMVEIHAAHGYLLCQFLSPIANRRTDEYGSTMRNRARFVLEVIEEVRRCVGRDFPISLRLSVDESIRGGYSDEDMLTVVPDFVKAGADVIHASLGTYGSPAGVTSAPVEYDPGFNAFRARKVKDVVDVPVIAVGRFTDPTIADDAIRRGDADLVSFGRQFLADPDFLPKARSGRYEDIRTCIACNQGCIERLILEGKAVRCAINPETGQETVYPKERPGPSRRVWIVGAGPAGLMAAYEASRLGHGVTVFEKEPHAGGQLLYATIPPFKKVYGAWIRWLESRVRNSGVEIRTGVTMDADALEKGRPDVVIIATGGEKIIPDIAGIDLPHVHDAWEILSGETAPGSDVLVIGGGLIGMETADYLSSRVKTLTLVEALKRSPVSKLSSHGYMLHRRLKDAGCTLVFGGAVTRIEKDSVCLLVKDEERRFSPVDQVVVAVGLSPRRELKDVCERLGIPHVLAGDAVSPRRIIEATEEGARAAWGI